MTGEARDGDARIDEVRQVADSADPVGDTGMDEHSEPSPEEAAATRAKPRPKRHFLALALAVVLVSVAAGIGVAAYRAYQSANTRALVEVSPGQAVTVLVPRGASAIEVGRLLAENGVVANARQFRTRAQDAGAGESLKAGRYELVTGMSYEAAIASLTAGPVVVRNKVTIPEGFTIEQIAARLEERAGIPQDEFLSLARGGAAEFAAEHPAVANAYQGSLEGYLFPKTYELKTDATARDAIEVMLRQFDKEIQAVDLSKAAARGLDLADVVVLASIIERETKVASERPIVSSVAYNRLSQKIRLDMCSTVEYVIKQHKLRLSYADLHTESPYNTYLHAGLPPGPIANPGLAALQAAAEPADTDYLYYVLTGEDGSHTFARTSEEFAQAKAKSKRVFGE